jgi:hypothetical protein
MMPVAEAISQWKWNVYHSSNGRSVMDFEVLDKCSRGLWGAFGLVRHFKLKYDSLRL